MKTRVWQTFTVAAVLVLAASNSRAAEADEAKPEAPPADSKPSAIIITNTNKPAPPPAAPEAPSAAPVSVIPPKLSLPPVLDEVVRLSKSGADQSVIKAYIEKAAPSYRVSGTDIIDLQDQGVSKDVILALVEQSKMVTPGTGAEVAVTPPTTPPATNEVPQVTAPLTPDAAEYYDALSPYGTWYNEPDYGWVWQPTAVLVNPLWRPYCDSGSWLWSDAGWYWNSFYSWGWAPFHFGRWWCSPHRGWLWCPDRVWGPSWVCWRNSAAFCGWAPLPPGACFTAGIGWTHWGKHVGSDCNWGLRSSHFTHVAHNRFMDANVGRNRLTGHDANVAFAQSRVVNNFSVDGNNRMVNNGIGREQIAAARGAPIRQVSVSEAANRGNGTVARSAMASSFRNDGSAGRQVASLPNRTAAPTTIQRGSRADVAPNNGQRAMPSQSFASRSASASPQSVRNENSVAMPRANNNPGVNTAPRLNTAPRMNANPQPNTTPRMNANPQFRPQQSRQTMVMRGSVAPSAPSRSFAAQGAPARSFSSPSTARPSVGGGSSFSGRSSFSCGGSMSVGRSAGGGGGGRR